MHACVVLHKTHKRYLLCAPEKYGRSLFGIVTMTEMGQRFQFIKTILVNK